MNTTAPRETKMAELNEIAGKYAEELQFSAWSELPTVDEVEEFVKVATVLENSLKALYGEDYEDYKNMDEVMANLMDAIFSVV